MSAHWITCPSCGESTLLREGQAFARCEDCGALVMRSSAPAWRPPGALVVGVRLVIVLALVGVVVALLACGAGGEPAPTCTQAPCEPRKGA